MFQSQKFGFQKGRFTEHAFHQLVDQIYELFGNNIYTIDIFVDLLKAFDTVDHTIFLKQV